ncbi:endonuclease 2 [Momordica charantia]|uniref:Aspergillus nuclease S1 n=1 Tax=Momordica charantia TaxID=3673 RepID=A0A6J1DBY6_MOMCH|nr:endonuclease 2 [Momordica charantia]
METCKVLVAALLLLGFIFPVISGWGVDGHAAVCKIAQSRLSRAAADAVQQLLPDSASGDLASVCSWADRVKFYYHWSSALHFIDTPDSLCSYQYDRDCKDQAGVIGRCVAGAINNYTSQLLKYQAQPSQSKYNLTQALLFLSHFMGDIHQPLHVGFTTDRGGNTIDVHWYTRKQNLHHIWDDSIIETAEEKFYNFSVDGLVDAIQMNITKGWRNHVEEWEKCSSNEVACTEIYASESIQAACDWAYKGASEGSILEDKYFFSRAPIVNLRLAQGGVRLAAVLNRIFS